MTWERSEDLLHSSLSLLEEHAEYGFPELGWVFQNVWGVRGESI